MEGFDDIEARICAWLEAPQRRLPRTRTLTLTLGGRAYAVPVDDAPLADIVRQRRRERGLAAPFAPELVSWAAWGAPVELASHVRTVYAVPYFGETVRQAAVRLGL